MAERASVTQLQEELWKFHFRIRCSLKKTTSTAAVLVQEECFKTTHVPGDGNHSSWRIKVSDVGDRFTIQLKEDNYYNNRYYVKFFVAFYAMDRRGNRINSQHVDGVVNKNGDGTYISICCELSIFYPIREIPKVPSASPLESRLKKLQSDFRDLHDSAKNSDVVLRCGEEEFKAHKIILSTRSTVFAKMFEHDTRENRENVVVVEDASAEVIKAMLQHLYCADVSDLTTDIHLQLYSVADKYDLLDLKLLCSTRITSVMSVDIVCEVAILAHLCHDSELFEATKCFFQSHITDIVASTAWMDLLSRYQSLAKELVAKP